MASTSGGSFIPKRSTGRVTPVRAGKRIYIFSYIAYVLFFGTLLSVVGIFLLNRQAESNLEEYIVLVGEQREAFNNRAQIESVRTLDTRLRSAQQILNWHAAPSLIFESLESVIVGTVQLDNFSYSRETGQTVELEFSGLTDSFDALLFQRDAMEASGLLASATVVNVSYGAEGQVIEGASRGNPVAAPATDQAKVIFTFADDTLREQIGYQPRNVEATVSTADGLESNETENTSSVDSEATIDSGVSDVIIE